MKTYLKVFFKKVWAILVRIFLCCVPYLGCIRTDKKPADTTEADNDVAPETEKAE